MRTGRTIGWILALTIGVVALACGGGRTAVVGLGNGGNRIFEASDIAEELADALAGHAVTPRVADETLAEIYAAILAHARQGDPRAALIVLRVAEVQREAEEE